MTYSSEKLAEFCLYFKESYIVYERVHATSVFKDKWDKDLRMVQVKFVEDNL